MAAAAYLFCHEGFAATGVDRIAQRSGAAKTTLYKHFASKERLIEAVLEHEGLAWRDWFFGELAKHPGPPRARLLEVFVVLRRWFADPDFYGCPFINAIGEFNNSDLRIRALAQTHKGQVQAWVRAEAAMAELPDPDGAARLFAVLIDGAIVAAQASRDPAFAKDAGRAARAYLDAA
jgi:AcrR family transcriptional regulator